MFKRLFGKNNEKLTRESIERGIRLLNQNDFDGAIAAFEHAVNINPGNPHIAADVYPRLARASTIVELPTATKANMIRRLRTTTAP